MAITAAGVGSGLDVETIVTQLMSVERQPLYSLKSKESSYNAELSAYGKIKSAISAFKDAMDGLGSLDKFKIFSSSSSDEAVMTASTDATAAAGIYNVQVDRLAQNHKLGSNEFADTATFGGTAGDSLTLTVGAASSNIDLSTAKTLTELRDAINGASDNPGVTATILNTGTGTQRLILTADQSGYDSRVQLSYGGTVTAGTFGFATTNQDGAGAPLVDLTQLDAAYQVDGFALTSASNTINGVLDGVDLQLKQVGSSTLNITRDTQAITDSAQALVDAYNNLQDTVKKQAGGALDGDNTLLSITNQMRNVLNTAPTGLSLTYDTLSQIGITSNGKTGKLEFDTADFENALNADFSGVAQLFANDNQGYAFRFSSLASGMLDTNGLIDTREGGLRDRISSNQDRQAEVERRLTLKEKSLRSQFASLDALIGNLQSTGSFLLRQLA